MTHTRFVKRPAPDSGPYVLNPERGAFGIILPVARTNLVINPSLETASTGYTAVGSAIARSTTEQYHGAYSLAITPTAATTDGAYYGTVSLTSGTVYAVSCKVKGVAGVPYRLSVRTTGAVELVGKSFRGTGRWQWIWLFWNETSSTTRRIYLVKEGSTSTGIVYWDGLQVEACASGEVYPTTYIDGDQLGLLASQYPPAYAWAGTPHASISSRSATTRAGGRVVNIQDVYRLFVTAMTGLGLVTPANVLLAYAQADGSVVQDIRLPARTFQVGGFFAEGSMAQIERQKAQLGRALNRDLAGVRQPLVLTYQPVDCRDDVGKMALVACAYDGGLEGSIATPLRETAILSFTQWLPYARAGDGGASVTPRQTVTGNGIAQRTPLGVWSAMSTGMTIGANAADVYTICVARDGTVYAGGNFTDAAGSGADYIAKWDGASWTAVGSTTALNSYVNEIIEGPDGTIYVGGNFTNAGGVAAADYIATWNGSAWGALSTGANAAITTLAISPVDGTLYAGGNFTSIGASTADNIAAWNGTAWSNLTSDAAINSTVYDIVVAPDGTVYVGGNFTNAGGVANGDYVAGWDAGVWFPLSFGMNLTVLNLALDPRGNLYAGGVFTTAGIAATADRFAMWNGSSWVALPTAGYRSPSMIVTGPDGRIYVGWNTQNSPPGPMYSTLTIWDGAAWAPLDATDAAQPSALGWKRDGTTFFGWRPTSGSGVGTVTTAGVTSVTNAGSAATYPRVAFVGPASGSYAVYELNNATTGATITLSLTVFAGETVVLDLNPASASLTSNLFGNRNNAILPGSNLTGFLLVPGVNSIVCYGSDASATITMSWPIQYQSISDLVE